MKCNGIHDDVLISTARPTTWLLQSETWGSTKVLDVSLTYGLMIPCPATMCFFSYEPYRQRANASGTHLQLHGLLVKSITIRYTKYPNRTILHHTTNDPTQPYSLARLASPCASARSDQTSCPTCRHTRPTRPRKRWPTWKTLGYGQTRIPRGPSYRRWSG